MLATMHLSMIKQMTLNTHNAAGVSRRQDQKKCQHSGIGYYIWNPYEKCFQKSSNIIGIGSLILEIDVNISEI